jgi:hypothetical protein
MITWLLEILHFACTLEVEDANEVYLPWKRSHLEVCDQLHELRINL